MGCMCMKCKYSEVLSDNHDYLLRVCVCRESEYFLNKVSTAFGECDFGIVDGEEYNEKGGAKEWKLTDVDECGFEYECQNCNGHINVRHKYVDLPNECPNCGAKMYGERRE